MAISEVDIFNMALSSAQEKATIVNPDENTKLGNLCRVWYPTARRRSLKAGAWPCATSYSRLALISERGQGTDWDNDAPAPGFRYAYGLPNNMLAPQYLHTWARFEQIYSNGQRTLVTNQEDAILRYTWDQDVVGNWDEELVLTVATLLGSMICLNINGKLGLADRLAGKADEISMLSRTEMANQENIEFEVLPANLVARGYGGAVSQTRYFQPFESLNGTQA